MGPDFIVGRVLFLSAISVLLAQSVNTRIFEECYGNTIDNFLTAKCDTGHVISIISLKAIAKRRDTGCPQEETLYTPLPSDSCCRYNDSDCGDIYLGDGLRHYFSCNGRQSCIGIPIAWMDTPCKSGEYLIKTNYMRMEYECISSSGAVGMTNNTRITDDEIHVWNPNYPDGNSFSPGSTVTCSVESSCRTRIVVTAIFLKFIEVSGVCGQQMVIEDGTNKTEVTCKSNNNYSISDLYTSSSHFIKINVINSVASNQDWRFWFKFKGVQNDSQITLGCGSQSRDTAQNPSPGECTSWSTTPTLPTNPAPQTNSIIDQTPNSNTTCPGKLQDSYLKPSCGSFEVIAVDDLFVGSKPAASNCPASLDIGVYNETVKQQCCTKNESDCITQYLGASRLSFFLSCNGRSRCDNSMPQTDTQPTACSAGGLYLANSNYMIMTYHCINSGNITQVGQDNSINRDPVYVSNDDFPSETNKSGINKTCSIQAECGTKIRVVLVYLSLKSKGACQQKITFTEEDGNQISIDCDSNAESEVKELFYSNTSFLLMTFSNKLSSAGGKFWIEFSSLKKKFLTVSCGMEHSPRSTCLQTTPVTTSKTRGDPNDSTTMIAILVPLGFVVIIAIVVCILCFCREKISHRCCGGQKSTVHPESVESIFDIPVPEQKIAPIATTFKGDKKKSLKTPETSHSFSSPKEEEAEGSTVMAKPQLRKYASEMHLLKDNGQKPPIQKKSFSSLHEKRSQLPAIFGKADYAVDAGLLKDEKAAQKERKRRRKEKKRKRRESRRRLLEEEQHINKMGYDGYAPNGSLTGPFRVAGHVANAFHPPVMRPYYLESGQENYYIPGHSMYDPQLPIGGSIYNYPVSQCQNFQNLPVNGTGSARSTSTPNPADGSTRDPYIQPSSMTGSFRGTPVHPNSMTGSFRSPPVQPSMSGSFRLPPIQTRPANGYNDEPISMGGSFHGGQIPMDRTLRDSRSLRRHPSAMLFSQRAGESPIIYHPGQFEGQGSMYEPYKNPAVSRWRRAVVFASCTQMGGTTLEIGSVDNPNEREVNIVNDDSVV
ncbi:hypothetical protein CHS0354_002344 [Potamilus streckersoni]|uniref:CUB domain-containing protein n=1 Tax=Potamilus streckersoni TaxID=2493646 RepID=A0AAE0SP65_9BIVA|nr:hypothetical protein CHS0354_002344 [Potamilus streckersoni]